MSDAIAVCCVQITTSDYFASVFYSGKTSPGLVVTLEIAPTPKVSN